MTQNYIALNNLSVFPTNHPTKKLVNNVSFAIPKGRIVGIVGESGSGKSLSMKSMMNLLPENLSATFDTFEIDGNAVTVDDRLPMAMIFQDPMTSLNPLRTIEFHLLEVIQRYQKVDAQTAQQLAVDMLEKVGITQPNLRLKQYPFELSGGMRQRIMIAMALLSNPKILIADEPTTALDVTIQLQILALIFELKQQLDLTIIIVSHDFGVIASLCDDVVVMYNGQVVESGNVNAIFNDPKHAYTKRLLQLAKFDTTNMEAISDHQQSELVAVTPTHHVRMEVSHD